MLIFLTQPPSSWSSSKPFCNSLQLGELAFSGSFHGGLTTDLTGSAQF